jgi:hypothetical protein
MAKDPNKKGLFKRISESRFGEWVKDKAPNILDGASEIVEKFTGIDFYDKVDEEMKGDGVSHELKIEWEREKNAYLLEMARLDVEHEKEITARWQSDTNSQSWLVRHTRPLIVLSCVLFLFVLLICDMSGAQLRSEWISLYEVLLITAVGGYFALREFGKANERKYDASK